MKLYRMILAALLVLSMLLPLASCQKAPLTPPPEEVEEEKEGEKETTPGVEESDMPLTEYSIEEVKDSLKLLGERTGFSDEELLAEWSGSGFEMRVNVGEEGTDLRVGFRCNYAARWKVLVDGELWGERFATSTGNRKQIIARGIPAGEHTIALVKDTEPAINRNNYNSILSVAFNGEFLEPNGQKDLYLEFIGDGYLTGFGNLGSGSGSSKSKIVEETSVTAALPYLTAQALNADYSIVAHSQIGFKKAAGPFTLPGLYDNQYAYRELDTAYDPERVPDAIVIHLGTDDTMTSVPSGIFVETAANYIETLRNEYYGGKQVPVIWLYNTMYHAMRVGDIKALVQYMGGASAGVYALELHYGASGSGTTGTVRYPNAEEHQKSTDILVPYLKDLLKLN